MRIYLATTALALAALPLAGRADPTIAWSTCSAEQVGPGVAALGARLQCGVLQAPRDHLNPDGPRIAVGVVRIRAKNAAQREGAIFFNNGGPGANPSRLLRSIAVGWSGAEATDPGGASKRALAERYDLVAVIPRGLLGGWQYRCLTGLPPRYAFLPTDLGETNWQLALDEAQARADACTALPESRFINTEQHVHDMDMVRRILGEDKLHFYGISYGGKVGAWYAAMYPAHVGRMLLDSTMTFTHDFQRAMEASLVARQRRFADRVLAPLTTTPLHYGLGSDPLAVTTAVETLPHRARAKWFHVLDEPERLAAAIRLAEWIEQDGLSTRREFETRIQSTTFSPDRGMHRAIAWAATQLAGLYTAPEPTTPLFAMGQDGDSVRQAVACNDSYWYLSDQQILAMAVRNAAAFLFDDSEVIMEQLICTRWGAPGSRQPDLATLSQAPAFLMLQAEKDVATPISGARDILARFPNARLLVAGESEVHGLFNFTTSTCVEGKAARYLLDGSLDMDATRTLTCDVLEGSPLSALPASTTPTPTTPGHDEF